MAWRIERLRRIGYVYAAVCLACTVLEYAFGAAVLASIYAFNTSFIIACALLLTERNHLLIERLAIGTSFVTCVAAVLVGNNVMNFSYVLCLLCVISIHEHNPRWRRIWYGVYGVSLAIAVGYFSTGTAVSDPVQEYYGGLLPLGCAVVVLAALLHEYGGINRQAHRSYQSLNAELAARVEQARRAADELEEQSLSRQRVSRSIAQSIASVHRTRSRLQANHEQLEQFAYAASHDLKEPVRTIRSFMQMARRKMPAAAAADASLIEHFDYIETNALAMHTVLERLLLYSRASRVEAVAKTVALQRVWQMALVTTEMPAEIKQQQLLAAKQSDTVLVTADASKLQAIFSELITNALRFVAPGQTPCFHLEVDEPEHGMVCCRVTDRGIGIETQYLDQVFGLFKRLHPREQYPSSGVGLALVKRLVDQLGAHIDIRSCVDVGTTVELTLPAGPG